MLFEESKENPELRQEFLNKSELKRAFVNSIKYDSTNQYKNIDLENEIAMRTVINPNQNLLSGIMGTKSDIVVYPTSFTWFIGSTKENFLSTMEHELRHAKQAYMHPEKYFPQLSILKSENYSIEQKEDYIIQTTIIAEIDAYENQLADIRLGKRNVTNDLENCIIKNLKHYYSKLSQQKLL